LYLPQPKDFIKQEVDKEYSESQREIRFFRIELDTEKDRGEERRGHILQVESDLNAAKRQLNELEKEESEQIRELRGMAFFFEGNFWVWGN
jgi:septal ring factor EnvC (AmiA/AmiB activator)